MKYPHLQSQIPENHVMLLYWVRIPESDSRHTASSSGHTIVPARGCVAAARRLDVEGSRDFHDQEGRGYVTPGHGVDILWPSGRLRHVRA